MTDAEVYRLIQRYLHQIFWAKLESLEPGIRQSIADLTDAINNEISKRASQ